jgi:hypothetical protein
MKTPLGETTKGCGRRRFAHRPPLVMATAVCVLVVMFGLPVSAAHASSSCTPVFGGRADFEAQLETIDRHFSGGVEILSLPAVTNLTACVDLDGALSADSELAPYLGCGTPCMSLFMQFAGTGTVTITLDYQRDDQRVTESFSPQVLTVDRKAELCIRAGFPEAPPCAYGPNSPPIADFNSSCVDLSCEFDATPSSDPDGSIFRYDWSFGDGETAGSLHSNTAHAYVAPGTYDVGLTVTDNRGDTGTFTKSVTVYAPLSITTTVLPAGTKNVSYSHALDADGGLEPYTWRLLSGSLPPGLSLSPSGTLSGKPRKWGTYSFAVEVTDSQPSPRSARANLSITIASK